MLAMGLLATPLTWPAIDDLEGWNKMIAESDAFAAAMFESTGSTLARDDTGGELEELDLGFPVYVVTPEGLAQGDRRVYLNIHGGAWVFGAGRMCKVTSKKAAAKLHATVWSVDYRMPPDHPYPTPVDDCVASYRALLEHRRPEEIVIGGESAGANLAAALILRARDEGLPLPTAVVLESGAYDLTLAGDTWRTNLGVDTILTSDVLPAVELYADGEDLRHPYISPLFGDLAGFPPSILLSGTRDLLLSDTVRMHRALRRAGRVAELHVWEAAGHGMFLGNAPEDADRAAEIRRFTEEH
jgi:acetyl esterase/lipase